jgi:signal transduction histidine kinase
MVQYEASQQIFSGLNIRYMLEGVAGYLIRLFQADECAIFLKNDEGKFSMEIGRNVSESSNLFCMEIVQTIAKFPQNRTRAYVFHEEMPRPPEFADLKTEPCFYSSAVLTLSESASLLGILYLARVRNREFFNSVDLHNLSAFSSKISHVLQSSCLYNELEQKIDGLKGAQREISDVRSTLQNKEKFSRLGVTMSEMAHEINNPLSAVVGYVDLILQESNLDAEVKDQLGIVFREAQRCNGMVQDLLSYSRPRKPEFRPEHLERVISEVLEVLTFEIGRLQAHVCVEVAQGLPAIEIDISRIKQLFLNLIKNACHALEEKVSDRCMKINAHLLPEGKVEIVISDNGPGIPPDIMGRIFDPFVTTKASSERGTGLGLSISKTIVEEHGGQISVSSDCRNGEGTSFKVVLPVRQ